jgi:hypothetical protein
MVKLEDCILINSRNIESLLPPSIAKNNFILDIKPTQVDTGPISRLYVCQLPSEIKSKVIDFVSVNAGSEVVVNCNLPKEAEVLSLYLLYLYLKDTWVYCAESKLTKFCDLVIEGEKPDEFKNKNLPDTPYIDTFSKKSHPLRSRSVSKIE